MKLKNSVKNTKSLFYHSKIILQFQILKKHLNEQKLPKSFAADYYFLAIQTFHGHLRNGFWKDFQNGHYFLVILAPSLCEVLPNSPLSCDFKKWDWMKYSVHLLRGPCLMLPCMAFLYSIWVWQVKLVVCRLICNSVSIVAVSRDHHF